MLIASAIFDHFQACPILYSHSKTSGSEQISGPSEISQALTDAKIWQWQSRPTPPFRVTASSVKIQRIKDRRQNSISSNCCT